MVIKICRLAALAVSLTSCVVVPVAAEKKEGTCGISEDRQTLKVMDFAKDTQSFYSLQGMMVTPISFPTSAVISGVYVSVYNTYKLGETLLVCKKPQ
ncbi:MAG TPA: hypothetical protein PKE57_02690 [Cellvibrionaceae bacterium]|nr:hypothetical protein [Cellvibrionaceae bacterium]HMW46977.1 hypothetical protein [Cellvibrionaceae bacterium]HMW70868.1 hypothetical protein [Cellvibrionaceae bacterium]HMY38397.1 hypothetical protein [Marinagarivorans sp.]HNG59805.1 hypothetical protein [Cellvibrionaceae bacterium]